MKSHTQPEARKPASSRNPQVATRPQPDQGGGRDEVIRQTAYFIYEARGRIDGHELDDWLQAEAQMGLPECGSAAAVAQSTAPARSAERSH